DALHSRGSAILRGATGPDGSQTRSRQHPYHRLADVGCVRGNPVTNTHTLRTHELGQTRNSFVQLAKTAATTPAVLTQLDQGRLGIGATQQVTRKIQPGVRKPPRARHARRVVDDAFPTRLGDHLTEVPYGPPESIRRVHRKAMQPVIDGQVDAVTSIDLADEGGEVGSRHPLRRRCPNRITHDERRSAGITSTRGRMTGKSSDPRAKIAPQINTASKAA